MNPTLHRILTKHSPDGSIQWLDEQLQKLDRDLRDRDFFLAYGACARHFGKNVLPLDESDRSALAVEYPNFNATDWPADELARVLLLTALPGDRNLTLIDRLASTADVRETIALYKGMYFLENAADFISRVRDGLRTNITSVFDAIALDNPYPAQYLPKDAWNQMALKAMFMQRPIYRIYRIEDRKNPELAEIFLDYAEERRSAHRPVSPELWRFVADHASERARSTMQDIAKTGTPLEQKAVRKALNSDSDTLNWDQIGREAEDSTPTD